MDLSHKKLLDIIKTMIEWNLLDPSRIADTDYVAERVILYLKARAEVIKWLK